MIRYDPDKHHRRSIRLSRYDYARPGAYFVTICTYNRECLLGEVVNGRMILNAYGRVVAEEWVRSGEIRQEVRLDEFVVMPNHLHGIVIITDGEESHFVGAHGRAPLLLHDPPHQSNPWHAQNTPVATQLLRAHHQKRARIR